MPNQIVHINAEATDGDAFYFGGQKTQYCGTDAIQRDLSDSSFSRIHLEGSGADGKVFYAPARGRTSGTMRQWIGLDNVGNVSGDQKQRPKVVFKRR